MLHADVDFQKKTQHFRRHKFSFWVLNNQKKIDTITRKSVHSDFFSHRQSENFQLM